MAKTQTRRITKQQPTKKQQEEEEGEATTKKPTPHSKNMKKVLNRGVWTAEEDTKLAEVIQIYGPRRWKAIAAKAGLDRCGKSCRLRWMNYLRPNIKRGNISDQEEDLILRLHKLLGNRWSLIAGRLPGRTDNEIKNYWNSHLSKKLSKGEEQTRSSNLARKPDPTTQTRRMVYGRELKITNDNRNTKKSVVNNRNRDQEEISKEEQETTEMEFNVDDFFDFSNENPLNLAWVNRFIELDDKS